MSHWIFDTSHQYGGNEWKRCRSLPGITDKPILIKKVCKNSFGHDLCLQYYCRSLFSLFHVCWPGQEWLWCWCICIWHISVPFSTPSTPVPHLPLSSDVISSHNNSLDYTLSPIQPPLPLFDNTDSDLEDEMTLHDAPSSPLKLSLPYASPSFNTAILDLAQGAIAHDDNCQSDRNMEYCPSPLQLPLSFLTANSNWEEVTVFSMSSSPIHNLNPPAPQHIHLLDDDSADTTCKETLCQCFGGWLWSWWFQQRIWWIYRFCR